MKITDPWEVPEGTPPMKSQGEIQKVAEAFLAVMSGEMPVLMHPAQMPMASLVMDVLCWVLNNGPVERFQEVVDNLFNSINEAGCSFNDAPPNMDHGQLQEWLKSQGKHYMSNIENRDNN
jgi:hypothetical protein